MNDYAPNALPHTPEEGLSHEEAKRLAAAGHHNIKPRSPGKTTWQIVRDNLFTLFNLLNVLLAALVALTGSWRNLLFMGVVVSNTLIGTIQELRTKRALDRLSLLTTPSVRVRRGGEAITLGAQELVLGDLMLLAPGNQILADAVIRHGECEVDESLITGESEPVQKAPGDELLSGSFVVSGAPVAGIIRVGSDSFAARLTIEAKVQKKAKSELMHALRLIIRAVSVLIVPVGALLFYKQYFSMGEPLNRAIISTVAAVLGMIPEGLMLLTSVALSVGVLRLSGRKTLVQELTCIEMLARVDVLCLDKTGTLTEGIMQLESLHPAEGVTEDEMLRGLRFLTGSLTGDNATFSAIRRHCGDCPEITDAMVVPFSSARKWSGAVRDGTGWLIGAPEVLLGADTAKALAASLQDGGKRVLALMRCDGPLSADTLPSGTLSGFLTLSDRIRADAGETLRYFTEQGVALRIISGDSLPTITAIAKDAGFAGYDLAMDVSGVSEEELIALVPTVNIFARVTPHQKRVIVRALQRLGHTVAMTGDGINDLLALKDADCSVAMASGSDAARQVAHLVLMEDRFSQLPHVVAEGRRVINNIQRAASLYLVKNFFSLFMALFLIVFSFERGYPLLPIQLTLLSSLGIGIPSFFLALEPNRERVFGRFIRRVLGKALPGGITLLTAALFAYGISDHLHLDTAGLSTIALYLCGLAVGLNLLAVCWPPDRTRGILCGVMAAAFVVATVFFQRFFYISAIPIAAKLWLIPALLLLPPIHLGAIRLIRAISPPVTALVTRLRDMFHRT